MQELLGRTFSVGDGEYRVVDVRHLSGEVMVYAEAMVSNKAAGPRRTRRAAFHYGDRAARFESHDQIA